METQDRYRPARRATIVRVALGAVAGLILTFLGFDSAPAQTPLNGGSVLDEDVVLIDPADLDAAVVDGDVFWLVLGDESLPLLLQPVDLRAPDLMLSRSGGPGTAMSSRARTFRGVVRGQPDSVVCLSIVGDAVRGHVRDERGWLFIEPLTPAEATQPHEHRIYNEGDIDPFLNEGCATTAAEHVSAALSRIAPDEDDPSAFGTAAAGEMRVVELAIDVDAEFEAIHGAGTTAYIESVINQVDAIYEADLNLSLEIVHINIWDDEPDPYTETDPGALLVEFRNYWNTNHGSIQRDTVHLFTGKDLDGSTIGIAYTGAVCFTSFAYGLSQEYPSSLMPLLVAHEIGHNLGASHDPSGSSPRYIMYPSLGASNLDEFSDTSIADVAAFVASTSCLAIQVTSGDGGGDGGGGGDSTPPAGGGGGGGGGPVDPVLIVVLLLAGIWSRRRCPADPSH
ncbi:MAG: hypothetical protein KDC38_11575 [Planctomycetes bacterium]|nr:hypothetical protein [Planctomycetota bacterium]